MENENNKNLPMNWWNFCQYFRYPFTIFVFMLDLLIIFGFLSKNNISEGIVMLAVMYDVGILVFISITYYNFIKKTKVGYNLVIAQLFVELITGSLTFALRNSNNESFTISFMIYMIVYGLIFVWPNYVYFTKRKYVFEQDEKKEINVSKEETETEKIIKQIEQTEKCEDLEVNNITERYCTKCGKKVNTEWQFCNYCGKKL